MNVWYVISCFHGCVLLGGRQLAVDEQVGDLEVGGLLGQLLDRVAAVAQDAGVAVDLGDRAARGRGLGVAGVVEPDVAEELLHSVALDATVDDRDLDRLPAAVVGDRHALSHVAAAPGRSSIRRVRSYRCSRGRRTPRAGMHAGMAAPFVGHDAAAGRRRRPGPEPRRAERRRVGEADRARGDARRSPTRFHGPAVTVGGAAVAGRTAGRSPRRPASPAAACRRPRPAGRGSTPARAASRSRSSRNAVPAGSSSSGCSASSAIVHGLRPGRADGLRARRARGPRRTAARRRGRGR